MKKIVGILGMAAVLASGAFAADPATNFAMSEFTGSAEFGWKADFADSENVKMGMYNNASASLKFGFITAGDKVTTGDGVWGELKISNKASDATAIPTASVDTAKIHFVDGDFSAALNILKPSIKYGAVSVPTATPIAAIKQAGGTPAADDVYSAVRKDYDEKVAAVKTAKEELAKAKDGQAKIDAAKKVAAAEKELADAYYGLTLPAKPAATDKAFGGAFGVGEMGDETDLTAGFGLEFAMEKMFALNVKLMDNAYSPKKDVYSLAKDKKFGMSIDAALKAIDNLNAGVASTFHFDTGYIGVRANADYNFAINDKLYVKPSVVYQMTKANKDAKELSHGLVAGALFGWGAKDTEQTMDFFGKAKYNEGISVAITPTLGVKDTTAMLLSVGLYDQSLLSLLGVENAGTLKIAVGADMYFSSIKAGDTTVSTAGNNITAAVAYDVDFTSAYINLHGGLQGGIFTMSNTTTDFKPSYKFGAKVGTKAFIDNTDIFAGFELAGTAGAKKADKAELTIGTKISF